MPCAAITEWMGDHLDGRLDAARVRELEAHLATCEACRREWEDLQQTVALIRELPPVTPPADLLQSVHQRLARQRHSRRVVFWRVLNLPQTRVALAASCVILVGITSLRWRPANPVDIEDIARRANRNAPAGEATMARSLTKSQDADSSLTAATQPEETGAPYADSTAELGLDIAATAAPSLVSGSTKTPAPLTSHTRPEGSVASAKRDDVLWRADAVADVVADTVDAKKAEGGPPPAGLSIGGGFALEEHERSPSEHASRRGSVPAMKPQAAALEKSLELESATAKDELNETPGWRQSPPPDVSKLVSDNQEQDAPKRERMYDASASRVLASRSSERRQAESPRPIPRIIVLGGGDAAAARQILARFVVHAVAGEVPEFKGIADAEDRVNEPADELRKTKIAPDTAISGWIQAADYDRLLAALKTAGTPTDDIRTEPPADGKSRRTEAAELLFVTITLTPPSP